MADSTFNQPSFLGGEWSPVYQGRIDDPHYKIAMNLCLNGYPVEEGAWTRRSGFRKIAPTFQGLDSRLWAFNFSEDFAVNVEMSSGGVLRVYVNDAPVLDSTAALVSFSAGPPMTVLVDGSPGWTTGDTVVLIPGSGWSNAFGSLPNQQFTVTALGNNQYSLADSVTGANIDGSQIVVTGGMPQATIGRIYTPVTPYTGSDWYNVTVQVYEGVMFFFHPGYFPQQLQVTNANYDAPNQSTFVFSQPLFDDGPYFDPVDTQTATVSGTSGTITVTFTGGFGPNQSVPTANDVGRIIRLFNTPTAWNSGSQYTAGESVTYGDLYYTALVTTTAGLAPNATPQQWYPNTEAAAWVWGVITAYVGPTQVSLALEDTMLYNNTITQWQLGAIGDPGNNPVCGCVHEGRLWVFAGTWLYGSQSGNGYGWSPTLSDGTVVDSSGISYQLQSGDEDSNSIIWAITGPTGMILGTAAGEWIVKASQLDDPLTPTSIQARRVTRYKTYAAKPVGTPLATVFIQRYRRKVMEFLPDVFTGRYVAPNLAATAKHLTVGLLEELCYQEEVTPIIWTRTVTGYLRGITYRRTSAFVTEAPAFVGWHQHTHGQSRLFNSIQTGPTPDGSNLDGLYAVTSGQGYWQIERLTKQFDVGDSVYASWFLDNGTVPSAVFDTGTGIEMWGFYDKKGLSVEVFVGGLDCGAFTVGSLGQITVPYTSALTPSYLQSLTGQNFGEAGTSITYTVSTTPTRSPTPATIGNYLDSVNNSGGSAGANLAALVDYGNNALYTIAGSDGGGTSWQIHSYNLSSRSAGTSVNADSLSFSNLTQPYCFCLAPNGNIMLAMDNNDSMEVMQVAPSTMTAVSTFGSSSNSGPSQGSASTCGHINSAVCVGCTGGNYMVAVNGIPTNTSSIYVLCIDTMAFSYGAVNVNNDVAWDATLCRGQTGSTGSVYVLDYSGSTFNLKVVTFNASANGWTPAEVSTIGPYNSGTTYNTGEGVSYSGAYYISTINSNTGNTPGTNSDWSFWPNPYITLSTCGSITPADVDSTWSTMKTAGGTVDIGYDETDGNLLMVVHTSDAVTNTAYLIKVNGVNAAVMWKIPISMTNLTPGLGLSRIMNGQVGIVTDSGTVYSVNTLAGTTTTTVVPAGIGASATGGYFYDAAYGVLYAEYNYNSGTSGAPTQLSGTPSTFHEFGIYTPGTSIIGNTFTLSTYSIPAIAGFPYNSQGQTLRPLLPGYGESGAQVGPALGKKRRNSKYAVLVSESQNFTIGSDYSNQRPVPMLQANGTPYGITTLFSGVIRDTFDDDYSFDGMLAWATGSSCYPLTIESVGGWIQTSDL